MTSPLSRHLRTIADGLSDQHEKESVISAADLLDAKPVAPCSAATTEEERLARAIRKARDFDPDTLYQHLGDDYPIDSTDSEGRTFYKSWRKELPSVRAVLAAQSGGVAQGASDPLTEACRVHVLETALREIRRYSDENLGPSRSSLLNKIAHTADVALDLVAQPPAAPVEADAMEVFDHAYNLMFAKCRDVRKAQIAGVHAAIVASYDVMAPPVARSSADTARQLPPYVSNAAREAARDALDDLETNTHVDSDVYTLAQHMMAFAGHTTEPQGTLDREKMISALAENFEHRASKGTVEYATKCVDAMLSALSRPQSGGGQ